MLLANYQFLISNIIIIFLKFNFNKIFNFIIIYLAKISLNFIKKLKKKT